MPRATCRVTSAPVPLRLYLLGAFRIERDSQPIRLPRRKVESLLAYLVLHPQLHAREKLAALLWGDFPDAPALHSLRTSLAVLRQRLGNDLLLVDRENVQLNPDVPLWVDLREFESLQSEPGMLRSTVSLYRGDLLSDFYDDWITSEREQYRDLYIDALLRLTQDLRAHSEYDRAIEYAQQVLTYDATNERAHQHLMFCFLARGDRSAALRQFEECQRILRDELSAEPNRETTALSNWIRQASALARSPAALLTNLPIPLSSFVGRTRETAEVKSLLATTRVMTLIGAGGSGKTRLAIQAASDLVDSFKDGVWWVELAALTDGALVAQAIAKTLGVREWEESQPIDVTLVDHLRSRQILLVLDNCEHLVAACAQLAGQFLSACPDLKVLATSREALGIPGEVAWRIPTLSLPRPEQSSFVDRTMEYEGTRLFVERATAANRDFALTDETVSAVVQVCRRLDGMPLAIELAAARITSLSVHEIAERLDDRFKLLTLSTRAALPRQQTLRASIDWSHDLLPEPERVLFRRLSVFAGGWTLRAAEVICAGDMIQHDQVLDLLARLVGKSLVLLNTRGNATRYYMLETIRQYALEKLSNSGETEKLGDRHLDYFVTLAEEAEPYLTSANRGTWLDRLESEHDNLHAALEWSRADSARREKLLRLAGALFEFWSERSYLTEGRKWLTEALERADSTVASSARAKGLYGAAFLARSQGDVDLARDLHDQSVTLWRALGAAGKHGLAHALVAQGWVERDQGHPAIARSLTEESVALFRELGDPWGLAHALNNLGMAIRDQEDYDLARALMEESAAIWRELGDEAGVASAINHSGLVAYRRGDYGAASLLFEDALKIRQELGEKQGIAYSLSNLGLMALNLGDYARAKSLFDRSMPMFREQGNKFGLVISLLYFGLLAMFQGDDTQAQSLFTQALALARQVGPIWCRGECLAGLAGVAAVRGQHQRAAQLWGAAETQMAKAASFFDATDRRLYEHTIAKSRDQLGETAFEAERAQGQALSLEQAVEYARQPE